MQGVEPEPSTTSEPTATKSSARSFAKEALREIVGTILLALVFFLVLQSSVDNFKVEGSSMQPTLFGGQYLLVNKVVYWRFDWGKVTRLLHRDEVKTSKASYLLHPPRRGDVIVFRFPKDPRRDFIKRVVGVPGDQVEIREGSVYVNGQKLKESYVANEDRSFLGHIQIPERNYFVLGDNRPSSNDSRDWGTVPEENIIGKAWVAYWPFSKMALIQLGTSPDAN